MAHFAALCAREEELRREGVRYVAGIDEAGRGPLAGDVYAACVAAASVLAKVTRDRYITELGKIYPEYGFERHKGYGTKEHTAAILAHGVLPVHRRTFLRKLLGEDK